MTSEKHPQCVRCLEIARGSLRSAGFLCKRVKEMGHVGLQVCGKAFSFGEEAILTFRGGGPAGDVAISLPLPMVWGPVLWSSLLEPSS